MFEPEEMKETEPTKIVPEEDDLKSEDIPEREAQIAKLLSEYPYKVIFQTEYAYPSFNAFKFLKTFEVGGEFSFNRRTYKNYNIFIKECLEHK